MRIAIDFDDTFTADPELWAKFIADARERGHSVVMVTARRDTTENEEVIAEWTAKVGVELEVIFTSLASKLATAERRGIKFDVWIDDDPKAVVHGH